MAKPREFPRYKVVDLRSLTAKLEGTSAAIQLSTFSSGGCGLFCVETTPSLGLERRVFCTFSFVGVLSAPLTIQGRIVYVKEVVHEGRKVVFYGVNFIKPHRSLVDPIVIKLQELKEQNQISLAKG